MKITIELDSIKELQDLTELLSKGMTSQQVATLVQTPGVDLSTPVGMLGLTVRTGYCLKAENIMTVGQLITWSENSLIKTPNLGRKSLNEIKQALAFLGLQLASDKDQTCKTGDPQSWE